MKLFVASSLCFISSIIFLLIQPLTAQSQPQSPAPAPNNGQGQADPDNPSYRVRFELGNGKSAEEASDFMLQKAKEWIHRVQKYTHDYTMIPVNPKFVRAVKKWTEAYDKQQQQQGQQQPVSAGSKKTSRQDDGDEEDNALPPRSPTIIRVAADVLLAVVGNRTDSIFNLTHQIQNVGKFVANPIQGISDLGQNVNRFLGLGGQKSGGSGGENNVTTSSTSPVGAAAEAIDAGASPVLVNGSIIFVENKPSEESPDSVVQLTRTAARELSQLFKS